jgi:hypothetical protein
MREGFVMRDKSGNPTTMYVQVDKYTFLELAQANADRAVGINHVGLQWGIRGKMNAIPG